VEDAVSEVPEWRQLAHIEREILKEERERRQGQGSPVVIPTRPGFFSRPVVRVGTHTILNRWVFLVLPLALLVFLLLRIKDTNELAPLWVRATTAGVVLLPAMPALRRLIGKTLRIAISLVIVAMVIAGVGAALHWWSFTLFGFRF
jgi:hypothetical protein